jgi:hypothetical protein
MSSSDQCCVFQLLSRTVVNPTAPTMCQIQQWNIQCMDTDADDVGDKKDHDEYGIKSNSTPHLIMVTGFQSSTKWWTLDSNNEFTIPIRRLILPMINQTKPQSKVAYQPMHSKNSPACLYKMGLEWYDVTGWSITNYVDQCQDATKLQAENIRRRTEHAQLVDKRKPFYDKLHRIPKGVCVFAYYGSPELCPKGGETNCLWRHITKSEWKREQRGDTTYREKKKHSKKRVVDALMMSSIFIHEHERKRRRKSDV